jgi:hypothetical protein
MGRAECTFARSQINPAGFRPLCRELRVNANSKRRIFAVPTHHRAVKSRPGEQGGTMINLRSLN